MPPSDATTTASSSTTPPPNSTKAGDAYSRLSTSTSSGRGSLAGWTTCPLCPPRSTKRYALGRGIAAHLHAVHTPWKLGKSELKRREKERMAARKRRENMDKRSAKKIARKRKREGCDDNDQQKQVERGVPIPTQTQHSDDAIEECNSEMEPMPTSWTPTEEEVETWGQKVAELTAKMEEEACRAGAEAEVEMDASTQPPPNKRRRMGDADDSNSTNAKRYIPPGRDRTGTSAVSSYRKSLPPLLAAAADGDAEKIKSLLDEEVNNSSPSNAEKNDRIRRLLDQQDRNGSIAEHWAAGGGHLACLRLPHKYRDISAEPDAIGEIKQHDDCTDLSISSNRRQRRRDGRTSLHFACKNGQDDVITYLLEERDKVAKSDVDIPTGDGTTPLHLACFSAHLSTVRLLIERYSADVQGKNDWGCGVAHWIAMSANPKREEIVQICQYLREQHNIYFHERQKQGHSAVHKAAQKKSREVVEWCYESMGSNEKEEAGKVDDGGNKPSDIWSSAGGDDNFAKWMQRRGW